jgi:hypothetical protein
VIDVVQILAVLLVQLDASQPLHGLPPCMVLATHDVEPDEAILWHR